MDRFPVTLRPENIENAIDRRPVERMVRFMDESGLSATLVANTVLLIAESDKVETIPDDTFTKYQEARAQAEEERIVNTCLYVARKAHETGHATGTLAAPHGTNDFLVWGNHAMNFDMLPDGSAIGFDLTARENIARDVLDPVSILAVHADSLDNLTEHIGDLYGGEWNATTDYREGFHAQ